MAISGDVRVWSNEIEQMLVKFLSNPFNSNTGFSVFVNFLLTRLQRFKQLFNDLQVQLVC